MFARVITVQTAPQRLDDGIRTYQDNADDIRDQPGFKEAVVLVDRSTGHGMSITLWESDEALMNSVGTAQHVAQQVAHVLRSEPQRTNYEVVEHRPGCGRRVARVSSGRVGASWFDAVATPGSASIIEAASSQPGYCGVLVLGDRESKHVLGMSFWDSMEHLDASEGGSGYYQQEMDKAGEQWENGWQREVYEVAVEL